MLNACQEKISAYEEIFNKLREVLSAKTDADVARGLDISTAALSAFKKQKKFPYERLVKFCLAKGISIDWLLTGNVSKGEPTGEQAGKLRGAGSPAPGIASLTIPSGNLSTMRVYEINGFRNAEELWETEPVETVAVEQWRIKDNSRGLRVAGTSMEPTIMQGSIVLVNPDFELTDGGVYLLQILNEGLTIKRVYFSYINELLLRSDNPLFPETKISLQERTIENIIVGKIEAVFLQEVK